MTPSHPVNYSGWPEPHPAGRALTGIGLTGRWSRSKGLFFLANGKHCLTQRGKSLSDRLSERDLFREVKTLSACQTGENTFSEGKHCLTA